MADPIAGSTPPWFRETELFTSSAEGYHTFRIPALAVAPDGTILAFCEGREGVYDYFSKHIVLKRSSDNGVTWSDLEVVAGDGEHITHNPCVVVDRETSSVWLMFCVDGGTVFVTKSVDNGASWSVPIDITPSAKLPSWTSYWTGPGHGIQLSDGTLVFPSHHIDGMRRDEIFMSVHMVLSEDHGETWRVGESVGQGMGECELVELGDGSIYLNIRGVNGERLHRNAARSTDRCQTWSEVVPVAELPDPGCLGSIVRVTADGNGDLVVFANCDSESRDTLTVRTSHDGCLTWPQAKLVYPGPAAYSDLAVLPDGSIGCLYERGVEHPYESIRLAQFNREWLDISP